MIAMNNDSAPVKDTTEEYDRQHGDPSKPCPDECVNLSEGQNQPPPQYVPFKITTTK